MGAGTCDYGDAVPQTECQAAVQSLLPAGTTMGRTLQIGSDASCGVGGWNAVPSGCSAQSGGDWTPHFQTASKTCGGADVFQLVCTEPGNYGATLWPRHAASPCCLTMLPYTVLSRAAAPWCCFTMMPHCDIAYTPYCLHTKSHILCCSLFLYLESFESC